MQGDTRYPRVVLWLSTTTFFLAFSVRLIAPTILVLIESDLSISHTLAGVAVTVCLLAHTMIQFPAGVISDILRPRTVILSAVLIFSVSSLMIGFVKTYLPLLVLFALLGIGTGSFVPANTSLLVQVYRKRLGRALGIQGIGPSLTGVVPVFVPILAESLGWRSPFLIWAGLGFVSWFLFLRVLMQEASSTAVGKKIILGAVQALSTPRIARALLVYVLSICGWLGVMSFFPTYLVEERGFSLFLAGLLFSIVYLGGIVAAPLLGALSDRWNRWKTAYALFALVGCSIFLLTSKLSLPWLVLVTAIFSLSGAFFPVMHSYVLESFPAEMKGASLGLFVSAAGLIGSLTPSLVGYAADRFGLQLTYRSISIFLMLMAVLLLRQVAVPRSERPD